MLALLLLVEIMPSLAFPFSHIEIILQKNDQSMSRRNLIAKVVSAITSVLAAVYTLSIMHSFGGRIRSHKLMVPSSTLMTRMRFHVTPFRGYF